MNALDRVSRVLKASQELATIPVRDWYKHMKAAIEPEVVEDGETDPVQ